MDKIFIKKNPEYPSAMLTYKNRTYQAVVGRDGVVRKEMKKEGDWKTPAGTFKILSVYYRPDRISKIKTKLPTLKIKRTSIWVDDPNSELYNQPSDSSRLGSDFTYESLFREDHLYDIFLDLDYNRQNPITGKGSAIFMHISRDQKEPQKKPTAGCIAINKKDLLEILSLISEETLVEVEP